MFRVAADNLSRLRQIAAIVGRHGYQHLAESLREGKARPEDPEIIAEAHRIGAPKRLRLLLQDLGPTFIKLGQVLSARPDLIPTRFQPELAKLQDDVAPVAYDKMREQLEAAWKTPVSTHLASIEETALATASIAQVHRARLLDGREVVIKIQRPDIQQTIRADIDLLYLLARFLDATIEEMSLYRPVGIVQAFERALLDELDFAIEARSARAIAANFEHNERVVIPEIVDALSTPTVLVMQYVVGTKITELDPERFDLGAVLETILDASFQQGFVDGLFHADPHPGNLLVLDDGRVCLLDFGLVGRLTANMQQNLIQLSLAIATRDADATARLVYRIGQPLERIPLHEFRNQVSDMMARYLVRKLDEVDAVSLVNDLLDMALRYKIQVPPDYALLAKASATIEGIVRLLKPDLDITATLLPYAQRLVAERYSPQAVGKLALRNAVGLIDSAQYLPLVAHQLISDLEAGRISVRVGNPELDHLGRSLNDLGTKVFLGMVAMGTVMGTFFVVARYQWEWHGWNVWALIGAVVSVWLTLMVMSWHFLYRRIRKVSMRTLMRWWGNAGSRRRGP